MATPQFSELRDEYARLWRTMKVKESWASGVANAARRIAANKPRYEEVADATGVPWTMIGVIHNLECGLSFSQHLHCGDPLTARTVHVPKGRPLADPAAGKGKPYTWFESACDALLLKGLDKITDWSPERICYELERYNGFGYRTYHPETLSPYLWSGSNHYTSGKYVADGKWDAKAVSKQIGAVLLLKALDGDVELESPAPTKAAPKSAEDDLLGDWARFLWSRITGLFK